MRNDVGLASIVATAPQYNLADTIYLSLYSTSAASLEIVQPFPNEIMVQGGGGVESTEIDVNIKDGKIDIEKHENKMTNVEGKMATISLLFSQ